MIVSVIFAVFLFAAVVLYTTGYVKKINKMQFITLPLILPFSLGTVIPLYLMKLPDSIHIMVLSILAVVSAVVNLVLTETKVKYRDHLENLFKLICVILWIHCFYSVFFVYRISLVCVILTGLVYIALTVASIIFFKLKNFKKLIVFLLVVSLSWFLNFLTLSNLIYSGKLYFISGLFASLFMVASNTLSFSSELKVKYRHTEILLNCGFILSNLLFIAQTVMMQLL